MRESEESVTSIGSMHGLTASCPFIDEPYRLPELLSVVLFRSLISGLMVLGMLSASSLPCADLVSPSDALQRVEFARASRIHERHERHGGHVVAINSAEHVHGASAPDRTGVESAVSSVGRDESVYVTAPCLCGCQSDSSASSSPRTQLNLVALPSSPDLFAQSIFDAKVSISSPMLTKRFPVSDWTPI
jgi:hypothetical protein